MLGAALEDPGIAGFLFPTLRSSLGFGKRSLIDRPSLLLHGLFGIAVDKLLRLFVVGTSRLVIAFAAGSSR